MVIGDLPLNFRSGESFIIPVSSNFRTAGAAWFSLGTSTKEAKEGVARKAIIRKKIIA
jgi:hypothetical protein